MSDRPLPWNRRVEPLARALGMSTEELGQRLDRIVRIQGSTASAPAARRAAGAKTGARKPSRKPAPAGATG